jgi:phosphoglycerol transferase MdoB-like AlkP superfamily enzyme
VGALALLNASLAFQNIWPTPAIVWRGELSVEFAAFLLLLIGARRWLAPPSQATLRWLAAIWVVLVVGHYADVTTPALYGRDINLYWDLRYMPDVVAMVVRAAPLWLIVLVASAVALIVAGLYLAIRWALGRVVEALPDRRARRAIAIGATVAVVWFAGQQISARFSTDVYPFEPMVKFSTPVTLTYARQARLVVAARAGARSLPASPPMDADLARLRGADVFLIFIESYGAIAYERPDIEPHLAVSRAEFEAAIRAANHDVVSAYVESPTFGGTSWLAHISLMSGVEVRDPATNASLMAQQRDTVTTTFKRGGYRTIALMPGLRQRWPEGSFYRFDDIYGAAKLDYRGPEFGWFAIPDQFSLARFDALEDGIPASTLRAPRFVFFPTISTHFPFSPTPPYQPDWPRMLSDRPYDGRAIVDAYAQEPDWTSFGPGYVNAVAYAYATLGGYLRVTANRDRVLILLGDHQPPAAVSGEHAPWDVPVHVITSKTARGDILDRLRARGFQPGLTPQRPSLGRMHTLLPILLDAFSENLR